MVSDPDIGIPQGTPMDPSEHSAYNIPNATQHYDGTQLADVTPLHPAGTFSSNTQKGDVLNGVARTLGMGPPNNVIKFPKK